MMKKQSITSVLQPNNLNSRPLPNEQAETNYVCRTTSLKINNLNVHVTSCFYPEKKLYDILFSIANTRLKEKPA